MVPLMIGLVGTTSALGAMGAAGVTLSLSTMILPSVLLALGCAYAMHILIAGRSAGDFVELERQLVRVARPVALSGLTTIFGFLAMATVRISAIRELATYGAVGVLGITLASLTLAPAVLTLWPLKPESRSIDAWIRDRCSGFLVALAARYRAAIVLAWVIALLAVSVGLWRLDVSTDIIRWFPPSTEVRSDYETIKRRLAGITPVNVMIEATNGASVTRPDALAAIGALSTALDELPQIGKAISVADPIRQVHRVFNRDPAAELPSDGGVIEQYLLLLEGVDYMRDLVSPDRSVANILLRMNDNSSSEIVALGDWVREWWRSVGLEDFEVTTTGIMYEFGRAEEQIAYGQIQGLLLAFSAIGLVLLAVLRRPLLALVALIPNVVPVAMAFGSMGLLGIPLDAATVCMGSLALGIAVDDTVHVATGYRDERGAGLPPLAAIGACLRRVLPALVLTTVSICAGFAVLGLSEFILIRNLGIVTALLVALCLLADVTLLPALLLKVDSRDPSR
jgi:predicted RND superfamily exporter protein